MKKLSIILFITILFVSCSDPNNPNNSNSEKIAVMAYITYDEDFAEDIMIAVLENATIYGEETYSGDLISDAEVYLEGNQLSFDSNWGYLDDGTLVSLTPGSDYTLKIAVDGKTFEQTLTLPPMPGDISPANGATIDESVDNLVTWELTSTDHDENRIYISGLNTVGNIIIDESFSSSTTSYTIPAGTFQDGLSGIFGASLWIETRRELKDLGPDFHSSSIVIFKTRATPTYNTNS